MALVCPDGRCALPVAPHWARTVVVAVGSASCQAHWPAPRAGATMDRWPTVPGVSCLIEFAHAGPIPSPRGGPNPLGHIPCQRPPCATPVFTWSVPRALGFRRPCPPPPAFRLPGFPLSVPFLFHGALYALAMCPHCASVLGSCGALSSVTRSSPCRPAPPSWRRCPAWPSCRFSPGLWGGDTVVSGALPGSVLRVACVGLGFASRPLDRMGTRTALCTHREGRDVG